MTSLNFKKISGCNFTHLLKNEVSHKVTHSRSFVLFGQGSSLLWTPALRPFESVQCTSPERGGELISVYGERYVG